MAQVNIEEACKVIKYFNVKRKKDEALLVYLKGIDPAYSVKSHLVIADA